jgi:hypothetical protein
LLNRLARLDVLLIDEFGYLNLKSEQSNTFFKLMEERYHRHSTIITTNLQQRSVPLAAVENALVLAAARRILRAPGAPPLGTIRSLAYFSAVIEEVLELRVKQAYFQCLRHRIQRFTQTGRRLPSETKSHTPTRLRRG